MSKELYITELFKSIQGETSFAGLPTYFIRLSGCNLRCSWCDTPYSFSRGDGYSIEQILELVDRSGCRYVCVTGGEPLLQKNSLPLMQSLCDDGYSVSLETGGSLPTDQVDRRVHIILDIKCPGSQMDDRNHLENLGKVRSHDEVKFVIVDEDDYRYAKLICEKYKLFEKCSHVLFSPEHDHMEAEMLVEWILRDNLPVRLNLQMHKFVWSKETRGV